MAKKKLNNSRLGISPDRLAELRRATIIASTGASTRLAGSKLTNEEVEKIAVERKIIEPRKSKVD